jgi:ABC-type branched-subunit amino acid transport system substrate-binding protein
MRLNRRKFLKYSALAGASVLAGPSLAGCLGGEKKAIEIGAIISVTGDLGSYGGPILNGALLAVKHVNAKGGVLGRELKIIHEDDHTDPQASVQGMKKLAEINKVPAVVGALGSSSTKSIIPLGKANKVVVVSPSSTAVDLSYADDGGYFFRTAPRDDIQAQALCKVSTEMGFKKISHIYINNDYGVGMNKFIADILPKVGGELVAEVAYNPKQPSYKSEVGLASAKNPEVIILTGYPEYGGLILKQAKELGIKSQWVLAEGMKDPKLVEDLGAGLLEGMVGTAPLTLTTPEALAFKEAFRAEFNADPGVYSDTAYDAARLIALAIEKAGKAEGPAIRDVLRAVSLGYTGASGSVDFDENGDVAGDFEKWSFKRGKIESLGKIEL